MPDVKINIDLAQVGTGAKDAKAQIDAVTKSTNDLAKAQKDQARAAWEAQKAQIEANAKVVVDAPSGATGGTPWSSGMGGGGGLAVSPAAFQRQEEAAAELLQVREAQKENDKLLEEAKKASAKAEKEAEQLARQGSKGFGVLKRHYGLLNRMLPGLGSLAWAPFSAFSATIMGVIAVYEWATHAIQKWEEELKKLENENLKPVTNALNAQREAVTEQAISFEKLIDDLEKASRIEYTMKDAIERLTEAEKNQTEIEKVRLEERKTLEMASLDFIHERGLISEQDYLDKKLKLNYDYEEKKRKNEEEALDREIKIQQKVLELTKKGQGDLDAAVDTARDRRVKAQAFQKGLGTEEQVAARKKEAEDELKAFQDKYDVSGKKLLMTAFETLGVQGAGPDDIKKAYEGFVESAKRQKSFGDILKVGGQSQFENAYNDWLSLMTKVSLTTKQFIQYPSEAGRRGAATEQATTEEAEAKRLATQARSQAADTTKEIEKKQFELEERKKLDAEQSRLEREKMIMQSSTGGSRFVSRVESDISSVEWMKAHPTKQGPRITSEEADRRIQEAVNLIIEYQQAADFQNQRRLQQANALFRDIQNRIRRLESQNKVNMSHN